jgi:hypothetical protein
MCDRENKLVCEAHRRALKCFLNALEIPKKPSGIGQFVIRPREFGPSLTHYFHFGLCSTRLRRSVGHPCNLWITIPPPPQLASSSPRRSAQPPSPHPDQSLQLRISEQLPASFLSSFSSQTYAHVCVCVCVCVCFLASKHLYTV